MIFYKRFFHNPQKEAVVQKIFVLDTSVLIHNPTSLLSFGKNIIVLPVGVLEELDGLKKALGEKGFNARIALKILDDAISNHPSHDISTGIKVGESTLIFDTTHNDFEFLPKEFSENTDNSIILSALRMKQKNNKRRVILISKDISLRVKAKALGIEIEDYKSNKIKQLPQQRTIAFILTSEEILKQVYIFQSIDKSKVTDKELKPNQPVILRSGPNFF